MVNRLLIDNLSRQVWSEWVNSDANIADIPSKADPDNPAYHDDYAILREMGAVRVVDSKLPPIPPSFSAAAVPP